MASKSITLILVLYVLFASGHAGPSKDAEAPGSTGPGFRFNVALDPKDPKVVELGKFAIDAQNRDAKSRLSFDSIIKAAASGGSGGVLRYGLVIGASDSTGSGEYYAYILVNHDSKELVAFRKKN